MIHTFPYFKERVIERMDAMVYFEAADMILDDYKDISYYSAVFEDTEADQANNDAVIKKSQNLLQKGISALKRFINKIRQIVADIVAYFKADAGTKSAYQKFVENVKNNPEFAGKKVTFKDYTKIAEAWTAEMDDEENKYRGLKDEELQKKPTIAKDLQEAWDKAREKLPQVGALVAKEVTIQYLLESARRCEKMAGRANTALRVYEMWMGDIEKDLGKKEAFIVKLKMKMLTSKLGIIRKLAGGKEKEYLTWKDALKNVFSSAGVMEVIKRNDKAAKIAVGGKLEYERDVMKGKAMGTHEAHKDQRTLKKLQKNNEKDIKKLQEIRNNDKLRFDQKRQAIAVQHAKRKDKYSRLDK